MRHHAYVLAALALAGLSVGAGAQEVRVRPASPAVAIAFGGSSLSKLGLTVSSGSERDTLGLLVVRVESDGPAERAGILEGDRLVAVNGTPLTLSPADAGEPDMTVILRRRLERALEKVEPGQEITLRVWSAGRTREVKVTAAEQDRRSRVADVFGSYTISTRDSDDRAVIGVSLGATGTKRDTLGVFIASVVEGGPAERAGIIEGHRIAAVNGVDVRVPAADAGDPVVASARANRLSRELEKLEPGDQVRLRVWADGRYREVTVELKRAGDVYRDGRVVRIGGVGALDSFMGPNAWYAMPSIISIEPRWERIEPLDSLWRRRDEIRRSVDPRFHRPDSAGGAMYRFRMDETVRQAVERAREQMERARQEMERVRRYYVPGAIIRASTE